jgi:hypothetical protein
MGPGTDAAASDTETVAGSDMIKVVASSLAEAKGVPPAGVEARILKSIKRKSFG